MDDAVVFFATGGGESIETATKMCRRFWSLVGQPEKTVIVTRERCYHGLAGYGTSIVGTEAFKTGVGPLVADTTRVAWDSVDALSEAIDEIGPERVAAFFCEPIIGAGGVLLPPEGYLDGVQRVCRERDVLFVVDEVICGFGRVGDWFASRRLGLRARSRHLRERGHFGLRAARRRGRRAARAGAVLGRGRRCVASRLHVLGPCHRHRRRTSRTSTSWSARTSSAAHSSSSAS